jgi:hypothetical protein
MSFPVKSKSTPKAVTCLPLNRKAGDEKNIDRDCENQLLGSELGKARYDECLDISRQGKEGRKDIVQPTGVFITVLFLSTYVILTLEDKYLPLNLGAKFRCLCWQKISQLFRNSTL